MTTEMVQPEPFHLNTSRPPLHGFEPDLELIMELNNRSQEWSFLSMAHMEAFWTFLWSQTMANYFLVRPIPATIPQASMYFPRFCKGLLT